MRWNVGDEQFDYDGLLTVKDLILFKQKADLGLREIDPALQRGDIHALMCLTYVLQRRAGRAVTWDDMMNLQAITLYWVADAEPETSTDEDGGAAEKKGAKAGATKSSTGTSRKPAATST